MKIDNLDVLVVYYNRYPIDNPYYNKINNLLKISINSIDLNILFKHKVYVINNSLQPLEIDVHNSNIIILDNSHSELFDIKKILDELCLKYRNMSFLEFTAKNKNFLASFRHAYTIQWFIDNYNTKNLLLCDSDIFVKQSIDFIDDQYITAGLILFDLKLSYSKFSQLERRIYPHFQYLNIHELKKHKILFFDKYRINDLIPENRFYDTGSSFLEDIRKEELQVQEIRFSEYCNHFSAGSHRVESNETTLKLDQWIYKYMKYL